MKTDANPDADPRRIAACLQACKAIPTDMLELPDAHCMLVLGVKGGGGNCLLVEVNAYDTLAESALEGAQYIRWYEELSAAIIEHLDPNDDILGGLIAKIKRAAHQIKEDAHLRGVMEQIAAMTENARGGSLGMRVHDLATDAGLDTIGAPEGTPQ
jgi:hypothetical protein